MKNHCITIQSTPTVKELKSKFEVGHKKQKKTQEVVHARNRLDKNRWREKHEFEVKQYPQDAQERADLTNQRQVPTIQSAQKMVDVPRVQYIDKVADIPVDVQRQVSTFQASQHDLQHIDEVVHVPALMQCEVPTIPDTDDLCLNETADGDRLEHENKKRRLPMIAEAVSESRADESDLDRFDDLKLREVRMKFTDDMASDMSDVKNELAHVRELLGVLVRRERCAETKADIAARRLDRMELEQTEADDAEHEANLQEALANQSKAVKVVVDKWFVDKGYGFGKAPKGEIVFIHATAVQGAEVLTIGTDGWVQVVNDDAQAQEGTKQRELGGETFGRPRGRKRTRTKWPNK